MRIYLLKAKQAVDYDSYDGHVVIAVNEAQARSMVPTGDEAGFVPPYTPFWTSSKYSSCEVLGEDTADYERVGEVILSSFNAG